MHKNIFYTYIGSNKAVYILNLSSFKYVNISLEFYKPLGIKRNILKKVFISYLCTLSFLSKLFNINSLKNIDAIKDFLAIKIDKTIDFNIDFSSSIFISATGDKVIVNHTNKYFEKFAFLDSYTKACHEVEIYKLINTKKNYFLTSSMKKINIQKNSCSFQLHNNFIESKLNKIDDYILVESLVDFFSICEKSYKSILSICSEFKDNTYINEKFEELILKIKNKYKDEIIRVGLTHWDFKIWNVQAYENRILIYDFEETKLDGLPLEDLYNYYIDAKIMANEDINSIVSFINAQWFNDLRKDYLNKIAIKTDAQLLLVLYLLNRVVFYGNNGGDDIVKRYILLLETIEKDI